MRASFEDIAEAAGVGVGTVYRRFPSRDALIEALFGERAEALLARVATTLDIEDPWEAVVAYLELTTSEQQRDRGLSEVLASARHGLAMVDDFRTRVIDMTRELVERAQKAGVVRSDVVPLDLALVSQLISKIVADDDPHLWRRYLALFLGAIRADEAHPPLTEPPPTLAGLESIGDRLISGPRNAARG